MSHEVTKADGTIVAWDDVPEVIQKKILNGTMTTEDWNCDWDDPMLHPKKNITDVVSEMLNDPKVIREDGKTILPVAHVHVFRKEYPKCMLKNCDASNLQHIAPMIGD